MCFDLIASCALIPLTSLFIVGSNEGEGLFCSGAILWNILPIKEWTLPCFPADEERRPVYFLRLSSSGWMCNWSLLSKFGLCYDIILVLIVC